METRPIEATIRTTLASYLDLHPDDLHPGVLLEQELELTTLDLVLVVLHVEDLFGEVYDLYTLEDVHTVGELIGFFRRQQQERLSA